MGKALAERVGPASPPLVGSFGRSKLTTSTTLSLSTPDCDLVLEETVKLRALKRPSARGASLSLPGRDRDPASRGEGCARSELRVTRGSRVTSGGDAGPTRSARSFSTAPTLAARGPWRQPFASFLDACRGGSRCSGDGGGRLLVLAVRGLLGVLVDLHADQLGDARLLHRHAVEHVDRSPWSACCA